MTMMRPSSAGGGRREADVLLRVAMFVLIGELTMWLNQLAGTDPAVLPWTFVLGGLGAVAAIEFALRRARRRDS